VVRKQHEVPGATRRAGATPATGCQRCLPMPMARTPLTGPLLPLDGSEQDDRDLDFITSSLRGPWPRVQPVSRLLERHQPQLFDDARNPEPAPTEAPHSARHSSGPGSVAPSGSPFRLMCLSCALVTPRRPF
jgi:hypothetical protein